MHRFPAAFRRDPAAPLLSLGTRSVRNGKPPSPKASPEMIRTIRDGRRKCRGPETPCRVPHRPPRVTPGAYLSWGLRRDTPRTSRTARWAIRFRRWAKAVAGRLTMRCVFRGRPFESDMRDNTPCRMSRATDVRSSNSIVGRRFGRHQVAAAARHGSGIARIAKRLSLNEFDARRGCQRAERFGEPFLKPGQVSQRFRAERDG